MTKEKLFELAVALTAANIRAGQFIPGNQFGIVVYDQTQTAFDRLEELWKEVSEDGDEGKLPAPAGGDVTH